MLRKLMVCAVAGGVIYAMGGAIAFAATSANAVDAAYGGLSVTPPTPSMVFVCHGFGCKYRDEVDLTAGDRAKLTQILAAGRASPAAERKAVAAAGAWFDRRVGPVAGTQNHVARAGAKYMYDIHQFDCIDTSRNTTSLLLVLDQLKLLRHHDVDAPEARGFFIDGRPPHATAVLVEKATGTKWSIDSWTVGYGQALEVMPLDRWKAID
ncbi:MAG TPA: hypothetical protein VHQ92_11875 [Pseudolabrys sp.]|jgi:hypothetical protein|nr:hypothetical protein [Pseudolabrys sp.]